MSVGLDQLRLAAAIANSCADADVELLGPGRRWLFSSWRPDATMDRCGFRQLVIATMGGCRVGISPVDHLSFVGALQEIGGGVFQRLGERVPGRRFATFLSAPRVASLLAASDPGPNVALSAHVHGDVDLGVTVVSMTASHPVFDCRLDATVHDVAVACLVAELLDSADRESAA